MWPVAGCLKQIFYDLSWITPEGDRPRIESLREWPSKTNLGDMLIILVIRVWPDAEGLGLNIKRGASYHASNLNRTLAHTSKFQASGWLARHNGIEKRKEKTRDKWKQAASARRGSSTGIHSNMPPPKRSFVQETCSNASAFESVCARGIFKAHPTERTDPLNSTHLPKRLWI